MQIILICALLFALGVALFAIQNATLVDISFLAFNFPDISLVIVILFSVLIGALIVFLLSLVKQISAFQKIRALEKLNEHLEQELKKLAPKDNNIDQIPGDSLEDDHQREENAPENSTRDS